MGKIELKPCPFCGGEKAVPIVNAPYGLEVRQKNNRAVLCTDCGALSCFFRTKEEAITAWNTRDERTCHFAKSGEDYMATLTCSECGEVYGLYETDADEWHFCPNCGCKIISGDA